MIHDVFNFVEDLIVHDNFLRHGGSPRFKQQWLMGTVTAHLPN